MRSSVVVPFSSCALFVRRADEDLRCSFATGLHAELLEDVSIAEANGLSGWVARHRRPLVNGLPAVEFTAAGVTTVDIQLLSALICPLMVGDDVIGTIAVYHHSAESYTEDHRRVLDQVARQAAAGVHNTLLFERTQEQAFKDALTGLANPRALQFQVAKELARARRTSSPFSLILWISTTSRSSTMSTDTLPAIARCRKLPRTAEDDAAIQTSIRYGGDEFVILLSEWIC